jgi:hypothetical protein
VVLEPPNRDRKLLGLGEEVTLTLVPPMENVTWSLNGPGRKEGDGSSITFIAPNTPCDNSTITAAYTGGSVSVSFETIKPDTIVFQNADFNHWLGCNAPPKYNYFTLSYRAYVYVRPVTVNFHKITLAEGEAFLERFGSFLSSERLKHDANAGHKVTSSVIYGQGSLMEEPDNISITSPDLPCTNGCGYWDLDWSYSIGSVSNQKLRTVRQEATLTIEPPQPGSTGTFRLTKGESGAEISTDSPTPRFLP